MKTSSSIPPVRVLANAGLAAGPPYAVKRFTDYIPELNIRQQGRFGLHYTSLEDVLKYIPPEEYPEAVVITMPEYLPVPEDITAFNGLKILLITDWNVNTRFLESLCPLFDFCFSDLAGVRLLKSWGLNNVFHQPLFGHHPNIFQGNLPNGCCPLPADRRYDISFCGNFNSNLHFKRNQILEKLLALESRFNLYIGQVFDNEYVEVLNQSRLVWNYAIRSEANMRTYEAMACGAIPLIEAGNLEVPALFRENEHFFIYSPDSLEACIQKALDNPGKLAAMQKQALNAVEEQSLQKQHNRLLDFAYKRCSQQPGKMNGSPEPAERTSPPVKTGALLKNNLLGWGFKGKNLIDIFKPRFALHPELEGEILPAVLLQKCWDLLNEKRPLDNLPFILEQRFFQGNQLPACLCHFFASLYYDWTGENSKCISRCEYCLVELDRLLQLPGAVFIRKSLYGYLIPILKLGDALNSDINRALIQDRETGNYNLIIHLLRDNCLARLTTALLREEKNELAIQALEKMSSHPFLSPCRDFLKILVLPRLGRVDAAKEAFQNLVRREPLRHGYWPFLLQGCIALGLQKEWKTYFKHFEKIRQAVYPKDGQINSILIREKERFHSDMKNTLANDGDAQRVT